MINDIKNHPLYLVGTTIVGSVSICILIFKEIVLPTMTIKLDNQIEKLLESENNLKNTLSETKEKLNLKTNEYNLTLESLNKELISTKIKLEDLETTNLFENNSPYPTTLSQIKIGDSINKLFSFYNEKDITKKEGYWRVNSGHAIFSDITYYFDDESKEQPITHILFQISREKFINPNFLQKKLENTFGTPKTYKAKEFYSWHGKYHNIFKDHKDSYILMNANHYPKYFPDK